MALQGDLSSFALPDVLRLLAGTGKSGRLEVAGSAGGGEVLLNEGAIVSGSVTTAPHAFEASDVLFELLRFDGGAFVFDEGDQPGGGEPTEVEAAITAAEALIQEWAEVEQVVPSMQAWISLSPEIGDDGLHVSAQQWRALAAVGGGGNARDLAVALELTDLATCRQVMELAAAELVTIRPTHGYSRPEAEASVHDGYQPLDDFERFEQFEPADDARMTDLEDLVAEDRPVVMEDREDALLPEPLPGEGVAYEGETITGVVDGRTFGTMDLDPPPAPHTDLDASPADEALVGAGDADPFSPEGATDGFASETSAEEPRSFEQEIAAELTAMAAEQPEPVPAEPVDEERDSLLKFLSSVKP